MKTTYNNAAKKVAQTTALPFRQRKHIFHSLTNLEGCTTIDEVAVKAGMDFVAEKRINRYPYYTEDKNGEDLTEWVDNPSHMAVVRRDNQKFLGTVGTGRTLVQYNHLLAFTEVLIDQNVAAYKHGGIWGDGQRAYLVMKTAESISIAPGEALDCYFYVTTSHDSSAGLKVIPAPLWARTNIVLVSDKISALSFRHTKNIHGRLDKARKTIGAVRSYFTEFEQSFKDMAVVKADDMIMDTYLKAMFKDPEKNTTRTEHIREKIMDIMNTEPAFQLPATKDTLLGAYFAVCMWVDHYMPLHTKNKGEDNAKLQSILDATGAGARRKAEALAFVMKIKRKMN